MSPLTSPCNRYNELLFLGPLPTSETDITPESSHFEVSNESTHQMFLQQLCQAWADPGAILIPSPGHPPTQTILGIGATGGIRAVRGLQPSYSG